MQLRLARNHYYPGATLEGTLSSAVPRRLYLRWRLEGRCDPGQGICATRDVAAGQHSFRLPLPKEPESYDGLLFRYLWEVCAEPLGDMPAGQACYRFRVSRHPSVDPYQRAGLRTNPFIVDASTPPLEGERIPQHRTAYQHQWRGVDPRLWLERGHSQAPSPAQRHVIQLLGVKGAGKSSHLKHWQQQQPGPYRYYPQGWRRLAFPPLASISYWDEADRIPFVYRYLAWLLAAWRGDTVCVGTHRDLSSEARRCGLRVTTIALDGITEQDIRHWAQRRIAHYQLDPSKPSTLSLDTLDIVQLKAEAGNSWRKVGSVLHRWAAAQVLKL